MAMANSSSSKQSYNILSDTGIPVKLIAEAASFYTACASRRFTSNSTEVRFCGDFKIVCVNHSVWHSVIPGDVIIDSGCVHELY